MLRVHITALVTQKQPNPAGNTPRWADHSNTVRIRVNRKSLFFLSIVVLCTACNPQTLPAVESSPAPIATQPSPFEVVIDNVATGQQGQLYASGFGAYGDDLRHFAQWDGAKWVALGNGFRTAGNTLVADDAGYLYTESLTDSEQGLRTAIMRWDGARWEEITTNLSAVVDTLQSGRISSNIPILAMAVDGENNLYAAGTFYYPTADHTNELPMGFVAKWDQETWTVLGNGFDRVNIFGLAVSPAGEVYISGEQPVTPEGNSSYITQWDGETWTQLNTKTLHTTQSIALDKSGRLYAMGTDRTTGVFIVYWNGINWITVTNELEGEAPAVYDMAVDENGHLYIGGSFEAVSGISARNIAYWDGELWHALGDGANERVNALALDYSNGELYAVGFFTQTGGVPVRLAARWDGKTWHALEGNK